MHSTITCVWTCYTFMRKFAILIFAFFQDSGYYSLQTSMMENVQLGLQLQQGSSLGHHSAAVANALRCLPPVQSPGSSVPVSWPGGHHPGQAVMPSPPSAPVVPRPMVPSPVPTNPTPPQLSPLHHHTGENQNKTHFLFIKLKLLRKLVKAKA